MLPAKLPDHLKDKIMNFLRYGEFKNELAESTGGCEITEKFDEIRNWC